ncbi:DEAD/DEAH box helicase [Gordonia malaquae]|uniref:DEAD/DEAH box helicase n=1 Tax=Gordonia malaquae TaxID=410332 RepID=UPI0030C7A077
MNGLTLNLTRYYADIQERANLKDVSYTSSTTFDEASLAEVMTGRLSNELTALIFQQAAKPPPEKSSRTKSASRVAPPMPPKSASPVNLVLSLVTLEQGTKKHGLLVLPASLQPDGVLVADLEATPPWIPVSRQTAPKVADLDVMVGPQAAFWRHRLKTWPEAVSKVESWTDAVHAALSMFTAVATADPHAVDLDTAATEVDAAIIRDRCFISTEKVIIANRAILDLYEHLKSFDGPAPAYEGLLAPAADARFGSDRIDDDLVTLKPAALAACGSMSDEHPLTPSQRRAVHAFTLDGIDNHPVTAVSGPPGTGKTTMLQSVVASTIVRHALQGLPAPLIVGSSTNNQAVTNIIDSFNSVTKDEPGPLDHRWLPRAADGSAGDRPLSGLAAFCPAQHKVSEARANGYLVEKINKSGVYSEYSTADYVAEAKAFFLARFQTYAESTSGVVQPASSIDDAVNNLHDALRRVDDSRRLLLEAKSRLGLSPAARKLADIDAHLAWHHEHVNSCTARLEFWTALHDQAAANPNRSPADDYFVIEQNHDPSEPAKKLPTLADYVGSYRQWTDELIQRIGDLQSRREAAAAQVAGECAPTHDVSIAAGWIQRIGNLDPASVDRLAHAASLLEVDRLLDTSARYVEFWLAVHLYEAQWLQATSGKDFIRSADRWRTTAETMNKFWSQLPALTPCLVMTAFQLPKYFKISRKQNTHSFDIGRADLLIIDEAGQVDTSVGAAAFAVAKRALVVGDVQQLAPIWSIDTESDAEIAAIHGLSSIWPDLNLRGLTSSDHSSIMAAASEATRWTYGPERKPGLFLSEHFRCHNDIIEFCNALLYNGLLIPSRPLGGYKLKDKTPSPFLFHEVPGSLDQRSGSSRVNRPEAEAVARWIVENYDYFDAIYNPDGTNHDEVIGVVTPFAAQASLITRKITELGDKQLSERITVGTAHRLQGAERPVVLFSSVYGNSSDSASFIDSTLELMNVVVSRAKDLFIVFGGTARWKDDGPVFSLVRRFATLDDADFADTVPPIPVEVSTPQAVVQQARVDQTPGIGVQFVDRAQPGHVIGSGLVAHWTERNVVPTGHKVSAAALNAALEHAGLIERTAEGTLPTTAGAALGIAAYEGTGQNGRYVNVIYSPAAQDVLAEMWRDGRLPQK